nr:hypothetical protein [Marinobacter sp. DS40M8]
MLKALVAVLAIAGVVALGIFGPRWLMSEDVAEADQARLSAISSILRATGHKRARVGMRGCKKAVFRPRARNTI